jgi:hypothetical protein
MEANLLFPQIVEDYKKMLVECTSQPVSLSAYCSSRDVLYKSVDQWMRRRGMSVQALQKEAFAERRSLSGEEMESGEGSEGLFYPLSFSEKKEKRASKASLHSLKGIQITFPDGVMISIKEAGSDALNQFIREYNTNTDTLCSR